MTEWIVKMTTINICVSLLSFPHLMHAYSFSVISVIPATERQVAAGSAYREGRRESILRMNIYNLDTRFHGYDIEDCHSVLFRHSRAPLCHSRVPFRHSRVGGNPHPCRSLSFLNTHFHGYGRTVFCHCEPLKRHGNPAPQIIKKYLY
jgi:hypothetical protein